MPETFLDRTRRSDASIGAAQKLLTRTVGLLAHSLGPIASTPVRNCCSARKRLARHTLAPLHRSPAQIVLLARALHFALDEPTRGEAMSTQQTIGSLSLHGDRETAERRGTARAAELFPTSSVRGHRIAPGGREAPIAAQEARVQWRWDR
jgi:hypothetical protein